MEITIDGAGRVVLPKSVRQSAGLQPGSKLTVEVRHGQIVLQPVTQAVQVTREGRFLVLHEADGPPLTPEMVDEYRRKAYERQ